MERKQHIYGMSLIYFTCNVEILDMDVFHKVFLVSEDALGKNECLAVWKVITFLNWLELSSGGSMRTQLNQGYRGYSYK